MSDPKWLEEDKRLYEPCTTVCDVGLAAEAERATGKLALVALKRAHAHIAELRELIKADLYVRAHMVLDRDTPPETP